MGAEAEGDAGAGVDVDAAVAVVAAAVAVAAVRVTRGLGGACRGMILVRKQKRADTEAAD